MNDFTERAVTRALYSELGKEASFWYYGRETRTPMAFVLDEVERQIGPRFAVYWVDGGPPEVFCLPGFSPSPVVFSTRYLSLSAFIRHLFVDEWMKELLVEVTERTTLKVMAEMALRYGDPDYAVLAFLKSVTGKGIWLSDDDQVMALEYEPKNEAYMATWFYGLVHELGHLHPYQAQDLDNVHMFSDTGILEAIKIALDQFSSYPDALKQKAVEKSKQSGSQSVLAIAHLREECLADIFACSVLFKTTSEIMREIKADQFDVAQFIQEMFIFLNIIAVIDRCRRVASIASATTVDSDALLETALHPVSITVRALLLRQYLGVAVAGYLYDKDTPTPEDLSNVRDLIDKVNERFAGTVSIVDSGVARAMEFSLFPERRENDWVLLEKFRKELPDSLPSLLEARRFCAMADGLGKEGKLLRALKELISNPGEPVRPDPAGDLLYFVPWVEGPNGFNRPFGLHTKHGELIFVFLSQDELYDAFFAPSAEMLKPGFTLKRAVVAVPREERLGAELAARMPSGEPFQVVVEGTQIFAQYMEELAKDTIWE